MRAGPSHWCKHASWREQLVVCPLASGCSGELAQGSVAPVGGARKLWSGLERSTSEPPMRSRRPHPGHFARCSGPPSRRRIRTPAQQRASSALLSWPCPVCSASLPAESPMFLPRAVERCTLADGYIPAAAQEVLVLLFLGERGAAQLVAAANQNRRSHHAPPGAAITGRRLGFLFPCVEGMW